MACRGALLSHVEKSPQPTTRASRRQVFLSRQHSSPVERGRYSYESRGSCKHTGADSYATTLKLGPRVCR